MKRFFAVAVFVFALFAGLVAWGAVLPGTQAVERSHVLAAAPDAVFAALDDLSTYAQWSRHVPDGAAVAVGACCGEGASLAWEAAGRVGSVDVLQSAPPDVLVVAAQQSEDARVVTYALADGPDGGSLVVARDEADLGGFPFLGRVAARLGRGRLRAAMDAELAALDRFTRPAAK